MNAKSIILYVLRFTHHVSPITLWGMAMHKYLQITLQLTLMVILFAHLGCSALQTVYISPSFDPEATILPRTGTVIYQKNGIIAMAVPLNDVKAVDAFGILIYNSTDHFISFKQKDCWLLDQSGKETRPIDKSQRSFFLGKNFKPKLPPEFPADVFRWNRAIRVQGDPVALPREDIEKTSVMPNHRTQFFLYFRKRSIKSSQLRIIIPKIRGEFDDTETTFVFKFEVKKG
jgi:hypothetical protein